MKSAATFLKCSQTFLKTDFSIRSKTKCHKIYPDHPRTPYRQRTAAHRTLLAAHRFCLNLINSGTWLHPADHVYWGTMRVNRVAGDRFHQPLPQSTCAEQPQITCAPKCYFYCNPPHFSKIVADKWQDATSCGIIFGDISSFCSRLILKMIP